MKIIPSHNFIKQLGIETCLEFGPEMLVPEKRIRAFCEENKCGNYGNNYMCPPHVGSLEEIIIKLKKSKRGLLLQYVKILDVKRDRLALRQTKIDFHHKILRIEESFREQGVSELWGMVGGDCEMCETCGAKIGQDCLYPEKARTSLEAIGVDVLRLLDRLGLDSQFHADKITWTGCILT